MNTRAEMLLFVLFSALVALACGRPQPRSSTPAESAPKGVSVVRSPPIVRAPSGARRGEPRSLLVLLHAYSGDAPDADALFGLHATADEENIVLLAPNGIADRRGNRFWNASPACCDLDRTGVDDLTYLTGLIRDVVRRFEVDPKRIHVLGVSNGGFMALRLACDASELIAGVATYAGSEAQSGPECSPTSPVAVLHMHGTADTVVPYLGGPVAVGGGLVTSSVVMTERWAKRNGCADVPNGSKVMLDLDPDVAGAETSVTSYSSCRENGASELFTIQGSPHVSFAITPAFGRVVWPFLKAHPKR